MVIDNRNGTDFDGLTSTWSVDGIVIYFTDRGVGISPSANLDDPAVLAALKKAQGKWANVNAVILLAAMGASADPAYLKYAPADYMAELMQRIEIATSDAEVVIIDEAQESISAITTEFLRRQRIAIARTTKKKKRSQITSRYEKLFYAIGQRDGFKCARCGSVDDLQIDHVMPLEMDGTNDLDNLQLLCRKHNGEKGATYVDYRQKA